MVFRKLINFRFSLVLFLFLVFSSFSFAAYAEDWEIADFRVQVFLNEDGSAEIHEHISADFSNEAHRGVERVIPVSEDAGQNLEVLDSRDSSGDPWDLEIFEENDLVRIQMWHPDKEYMADLQEFYLVYEIGPVILDQDLDGEKFQEFYWNVTGNQWSVPIKKASVEIHSPENSKTLDQLCFTGELGSNVQYCTIDVQNPIVKDPDAENNRNDYDLILVDSKGSFARGEGLTVSLMYEDGTFTNAVDADLLAENNGVQKNSIWNSVWFWPTMTFILMFLAWWFFGRDERTIRDTVIPHFEPPKEFSPTLAGTLIDEKIHAHDITATIIDFAVRGFIEIKEIFDSEKSKKPSDYLLILKKPYQASKKYEEEVLKRIFPSNEAGDEVKISKLDSKLGKSLDKIHNVIFEDLLEKKYFPHNPKSVRAGYYTFAGFVFWGAFYGVFIAQISVEMMVGLMFSAGILAFFGRIMPRKTKKGTEKYYELKGLYEYMNTAEKDRMKFQEERGELYEKLLPYAMAFGLIEKWSKAFEGIIQRPPNWYSGRSWGNSFDMIYFSRSLSRAANSMNSNVNAMKNAAGAAFSGGSGFSGGFSGGGFGGGGGGGL